MKSFSLKLVLALAQVFVIPAFSATETIVKADIIEGQITQKNYLKEKGHFEKNAVGWVGYDDGAAVPVDGTGGTVATTCTRTTTTPHSGEGSFLYTPAALGEGCAASFTIDSKDKGRVLQLSFDYSIVSGTYTDDDTQIWIVETGTPTAIQPAPYKLKKTGITEKFAVEFQTLSTATSYRVLIHQATAGTAVLKFDNFQLGPQAKLYGSPVTDWVSFTPTGSWSTNTTYTGFKRRVGDLQEYDIKVSTSGAPTSSPLTVNLGATIDTAKLAGTDANASLGLATIYDATGILSHGVVAYNATDSVKVLALNSAGTYVDAATVTQAVPFTFASGDYVRLRFSVPIVGWSSSQIMSSDANTTIVAASYYTDAGNSIANSGDTLVDYEDKIIDTHGAVTTGGSWKFTAPLPGYYRVSVFNTFASSTYVAGNQSYGIIYKNGSPSLYFGITTRESTTAQLVSATGTAIISLVAGDYIDSRLFCNRTAGSTALSTTTGNNRINIEKISGPSQIAASDSVAWTGYTTSTQTMTSSFVQVTGWTTLADSTNSFNTSTSTYTIPISGRYRISGSLQYAAAGGAYLILPAVYKNGSALGYGSRLIASTVFPVAPTFSNTYRFLAGDTITFYGYASTNAALAAGGSTSDGHWSIERVGNY